MMKKQIKSLAILTLFLTVVFLSGCTTQGRGLRDGTPTPQGTTMVPPGQQGMMGTGTRQDGLSGTEQGQTGLQGANPLSFKSGTGQTTIDRQKSENIREQLKNMNGAENVNVIVNGNTALVGYKPSAAAGDATATKAAIARKVKEVDNTITDVRVSESPDILTNMNKITTDINDKKPMDNIVNEFNKLFQGIKPVKY